MAGITNTTANKINAVPVNDLGTAELGLFSVTVTPAADNLNTTPTAADSNYALTVRAILMHCEPFFISAADTTSLTFVANRNTFNAGGKGASATYGGTDDTTSISSSPSFENLEEAIKDAVGGTPAVAELTLTGTTLA